VRRGASPISLVIWRFALSLAVLIALAVDAAEPPAAPPAEGASSPQSTLTYRVTVDAPSPLKETLTREVGLARWQGYAEMTEDLLARLSREAIEETRNFAAAEGYFSAEIDVRIDRDTTPIGVTLVVKPGVPTRIKTVRVEVTGAAVTDAPLGTEAIAGIRREWGLPEGARFRSRRGRSPRSVRSTRSPAVRTPGAGSFAPKRLSIRKRRAPISPSSSRAGPLSFRHVRNLRALQIRPVARAQLQHDRAGHAVQRRGAQSLREDD
jgi:hypothetical protein